MKDFWMQKTFMFFRTKVMWSLIEIILRLINCGTFDVGSLKNRFKLSGQLPLLSIQISDQKVTSILELIDSIPKPESAPATSSPPKMTEVRFLRDFIKNYQKNTFLILAFQFWKVHRKVTNKCWLHASWKI